MSNPTRETLELEAAYLKALADPLRLRILTHIRNNPQFVKEIVKAVGVSQPTVSKHLGILRRVGVVETERMGTLVKYSTRDLLVYKLMDQIGDSLAKPSRRAEIVLAGASG